MLSFSGRAIVRVPEYVDYDVIMDDDRRATGQRAQRFARWSILALFAASLIGRWVRHERVAEIQNEMLALIVLFVFVIAPFGFNELLDRFRLARAYDDGAHSPRDATLTGWNARFAKVAGFAIAATVVLGVSWL